MKCDIFGDRRGACLAILIFAAVTTSPFHCSTGGMPSLPGIGSLRRDLLRRIKGEFCSAKVLVDGTTAPLHSERGGARSSPPLRRSIDLPIALVCRHRRGEYMQIVQNNMSPNH